MNEYAKSKERYDSLKPIVVAGREAELLIKYVKQYEDIIKRNLLNIAERPNLYKTDLENEANAYRSIHGFREFLESLVAQGEQKEAVMKNLEKNQ